MKLKSKQMTLESAIALAANAHRGQKDLAGNPYILHPLRVMLQMDSEEEMMAAILHDVVEDTSWTIQELHRAQVPARVLEAVAFLTRDKERQTYATYINTVEQNVLARKIKVADLKDNLNLNRLNPDDIHKYKSLIKREQKALIQLTAIPLPYYLKSYERK